MEKLHSSLLIGAVVAVVVALVLWKWPQDFVKSDDGSLSWLKVSLYSLAAGALVFAFMHYVYKGEDDNALGFY